MIPRCPACNEPCRDPDDHDWGIREELVTSCDSCGKDFVLSRRVSVSYSASKVSQECESHNRRRYSGWMP